jgi:signal transduction histidine kinase
MSQVPQNLFIPFTRLSPVSTERHGLSLSIVRCILNKLGRKVGVESEGLPGWGCIFSFYLTKVTSKNPTTESLWQ